MLPRVHGGAPGVQWEDNASDMPGWAQTRFAQRPWTSPPVMLPVPFCVSEPERQYRLDPFHICKVGIYRDLAGSCLMYLVHEGYTMEVLETFLPSLKQRTCISRCSAKSRAGRLRFDHFLANFSCTPALIPFPGAIPKARIL